MTNPEHLNTPLQRNSVSVYLIILVALSSCYGQLNAFTQVAQYTPSIGVVLLATFLLLSGKIKNFQKSSTQSVICGAIITLSALLGAMLSQDAQSALYALVFIFTWMAILVILQKYTMTAILRSFAYGGFVSVLIYLAMSGFKIQGALTISGNEFSTGDRATGPFTSHPNLIAHNMAIFTILAVVLAPSEKTIGKLILYGTAIFATLILLSTASRGGLVALVTALIIATTITHRKNLKHLLLIFSLLVVAGIYIALFQSEYIDRLILIMDLNSSSRGLNSGLSGRQQLWSMVFSQFFTINIPFFWGGGFRNAWLSNFISAVDNGYIVIIAETGFISLIIILARLAFVLLRSAKRVKLTPNSMDAAIVGLVSFILIESIVARYFLAIGNPASFLILFLIVAGAKGYIIEKRYPLPQNTL
ncbi:O-antigen ligase family protein [Pseudomonas helleri]|uniref:O-antigen ligase family protein n=1 Tax=Pseudomonas helleri TaxID=1608996 RepID=UPI0028EF00C1|nr:O-antigen ligase family protein [Pseudomonas helleri]